MRKMTGEEFDRLVTFFDSMARTEWLSEIHTQLKDLTGNWQGLKVLDIGCGTGRLLLRGVHEADRIIGIDLSEEMIKKSIQNAAEFKEKASFVVGDACNLPFDDDSFDLTLSTCVQFLLPEPEQGFEEMVRVTKTGGQIVMLNPGGTMSKEQAESYIKSHQLSGFEEETLKKWANVSTYRHRYQEKELTDQLYKYGVKKVEHHKVLDGLALITVINI